MILEIAVQLLDDDSHVSQTLTLDGVRFRLETYTNKEDDTWYFDIYDLEDVPLLQGIAIVTGLDLLFPYRYKTGLPPGVLFVNDQLGTEQLNDPTIDSFKDKRAALYYETIS